MTHWQPTPNRTTGSRSRYAPIALLLSLLGLALLTACEAGPTPQAVQPQRTPVNTAELHIVTGQLVFVPAYSHVFYGSNQQTMNMAITLAIHNTDPDDAIIVNSVRYYDTDGNLVRDFVDQPVELGPMATTGFQVPENDLSGGWGANFMVEWGAEQAVYEPVIEAVMINASSGWGASFVSEGRVVSEQLP